MAQAGGRAWFKFNARAEHTYVLEAHGVQPGFDPYMQLYDSGQHLLAQNDDREMPNDNSLEGKNKLRGSLHTGKSSGQ